MQVENDLHDEDMEFQRELQYALDVLVDEHENVEMPSRSNLKSIVAYVEVGESRNFKSTIVSQLNGNPTLYKDLLTRVKASILFMKPKLLTAVNQGTMLIMVVIMEHVF